jgi:hypothetical protein
MFKLISFIDVIGLLFPPGHLNWLSVSYYYYKFMLQPLGLQKNSLSSLISHSFTVIISWKVSIINLLDVSYCWVIVWIIFWGKCCCYIKTMLQPLRYHKYTMKTYIYIHLNTTKVVLTF